MSEHPLLQHPYAGLFRSRRARSLRASSYDRSGANQDFLTIRPGETATLMEHEGPGCITHLYCAMVLPDLRDFRNGILRCYWDGDEDPSVEVPLGDFFGLSHGRIREFASSLVAVNAGVGSSHGFNAYFPMPFDRGARITLENRGDAPLGGALQAFWYHVEYEAYADPLPEGVERFHACYRQERPTTAVGETPNLTLHGAENTDGRENYVALDTAGRGRMVGLHLQVHNVQGRTWYGEGDDMVFVDGEAWPPSIHGTGTEEIFGGGACPATEYAGPYSGHHLVESPEYDGLIGMYRWYLHDPIHFARSLRWTVEHGHANNFANDYSSVAYWYQEPRAELPPLPDPEAMLPPLDDGYDEVRTLLFETATGAMATMGDDPRRAMSRFLTACQVGEPLYLGDWEGARRAILRFRDEVESID